MKKLRIKTSIALLIMAAAIISLSGCAAKKAIWGSMEKGMIMKYSMQPDKDLQYKTTSVFSQEMEVMGQQFTITGESSQQLNMKPLVTKSNDLDYMVTIEDMSSSIVTPKGEMIAKLEEVIGQSFNITISQLGEELEYSGAEELTYDYGTGDMKNISSDIQTFFPDLPETPVKVGDSWVSTETNTEKSEKGILEIKTNNNYTFDGLETINGRDCMVINSTFTGTIKGEGQEQGMELITSGEVTGTGSWYFAYKEGVFVKSVSEGTGKTTTEVKGPQEMSILATRTYTLRTELVN
jgi:hypothetical protein